MQNTPLCWIDGNIMPANQATISVFDHGLLYGDGVFEGMRFYHGNVLMLDEHLSRLCQSADSIALQLPYSLSEIEQAIDHLLESYGATEGYLRLVVTRGVGSLGIDPASCTRPTLLIIADTLKVVESSHPDSKIRLHIATTRRTPAACLDPRIKSLNYLNNIIARIEANRAGADEAVMLNLQGHITEGSVDNLFIVKDGIVKTPPLEDGMLAGITRQTIIDLARADGIQVSIESLSPDDLIDADECFLTGTGAELIAVGEIDGRELQPATQRLLPRIARLFSRFIDELCRS